MKVWTYGGNFKGGVVKTALGVAALGKKTAKKR